MKNKKNNVTSLSKRLEKETRLHDKPIMVVETLSALDQDGFIKSIIESPKGCKNKYNYKIDFCGIEKWDQLPSAMWKEIEEFFVFYNRARGKEFKSLGWHNPKKAYKLLQKSLCHSSQKQKSA